MDLFQSFGLDYPSNELCLGANELQWQQLKFDQRLRWLLQARTGNPGFFARPIHGGGLQLAYGWAINDPNDDGTLRLATYPGRAAAFAGNANRIDMPAPDPDVTAPLASPTVFAAIDRSGTPLFLPRDHEMPIGPTVPNDGVWRTLVVRALETKQELGTIAVTTTSAAVVGTSTRFTDLQGRSDAANVSGRGDQLRIAGSANGNDGIYEIDTVTDDENLTLVSAVAGTDEAALPFSIAGAFLAAVPVDPNIHNNIVPEWELVTRVLPGPAAANDLIVCDVMRVGGTTTVIDRRQSNLWRPHSYGGAQLHGYHVQHQIALEMMVTQQTDFSTYALVAAGNKTWNPATGLATDGFAAALGYDQSASNEGDLLGVVAIASSDTSIDVLSFPLKVIENPMAYTASLTNRTTLAASGGSPSIAQVPSGYGITHVMVYVQAGSGDLVYRTTADNGLTWSSAVTAWSPSAIAAADAIEHPSLLLTRDHRLVVVATYMDNSASPRRTIRCIFSDGLGTLPLTWDHNSNAGYSMIEDTSDARDPDVAQDDAGNLFTAFVEGVGDGFLKVMRGWSPNDPRLGNQEADRPTVTGVGPSSPVPDASAANRVGDLLDFDVTPQADVVRGPRLWCGPSGMLVFYTVANHTGANSILRLVCSAIGWRDSTAYLIGSQTIATIRLLGVDSTVNDLNIAIRQLPNGQIMVWYTDHTSDIPDGARIPLIVSRADVAMWGNQTMRPMPAGNGAT